MKVKNEMETVVKAELTRLLGGGRKKGSSSLPSLLAGRLGWLAGGKTGGEAMCDCPHCAADVQALALSSLPARYCLSLHYGVGRNRTCVDEVEDKVQQSLRRVRSRPRHSAREIVPASGDVRVLDFGVREGTPMVRPLLERLDGACTCERCRADALAYGLNRLRPRYGVEVKGRIRMPPHELEFIRHELLETLHKAARAVAENPRHEDQEGSRSQPGVY